MFMAEVQGNRIQEGGIIGSTIMEASAADPNFVRLHIHDCVTEELFLIDTGAEISLFPTGKTARKLPNNFNLRGKRHSN